jgi:hypothetical protein
MPAFRQPCEFQLLQYVPDPVRNEFVHVGVILRGPAGEGGRGGFEKMKTAVKFTSDWRRVRCLDPDADTACLEGLESELRRRFQEPGESGGNEAGENMMRLLEDSFSNSVQLTQARAYLAESMETGVEELMRLYVEPPRREKAAARATGRAAIVTRMRTEFERAGVWDLLRKRIAASAYTRTGDPLRIDLGYQPSGANSSANSRPVRMFQAVSLEPGLGFGSGVEAAKVLAFSSAALMAGVARVEGARLELTAVIEPIRQGIGNREQGTGNRGSGNSKEELDPELDPERVEAYRFAVDTMEEHRIRVVTTSDLGRVAETARLELGV